MGLVESDLVMILFNLQGDDATTKATVVESGTIKTVAALC
jgi:hypothetical protein